MDPYITEEGLDLRKLSASELADMLVLPEEWVMMCSEEMHLTDQTENSFDIVLAKGKILRNEGRTPIYLTTQNFDTIFVTSAERLSKQYH